MARHTKENIDYITLQTDKESAENDIKTLNQIKNRKENQLDNFALKNLAKQIQNQAVMKEATTSLLSDFESGTALTTNQSMYLTNVKEAVEMLINNIKDKDFINNLPVVNPASHNMYQIIQKRKEELENTK